MGKLTDEDIEQLLRETFADKEDLVNELPQATKRRSPVPALLAVAAVLVVLAGVLYGVNRWGQPDPVPPVASTTTTTRGPEVSGDRLAASDKGDIWGAAIVSVARRFEPAGVQWAAVRVLRYSIQTDQVTAPGMVFTATEKARIEQAVRPLAPVIWNGTPSPVSCAPGRDPIVMVGAIVDKGDHQDVGVMFTQGCESQLVTTRLRKVDGVWKVTATALGTATAFANGECSRTDAQSASPPPGC